MPGAPDQVDLNLTVVERPTGSLQLGAGFSSAEKLALSFSIKQENAFGTGQRSYGRGRQHVQEFNHSCPMAFSSVNPYFTPDGISRTIDVYHRSSKPYEDQGGNYELVTSGAGLRFGVPFSESDTVFLGGGIERTEIKPGTAIPAAYLAYAEQFGFISTGVPLTVGWSRDDRDEAPSHPPGAASSASGQRTWPSWAKPATCGPTTSTSNTCR